jgi:hypothetical protein
MKQSCWGGGPCFTNCVTPTQFSAGNIRKSVFSSSMFMPETFMPFCCSFVNGTLAIGDTLKHETMSQHDPDGGAFHLSPCYWTFSEHSVSIQWAFSEHAENIPWTFSEHLVNIQWFDWPLVMKTQSCFAYTQWTFSERSVNIQWTFGEHLVNSQWTFSELSVNLQCWLTAGYENAELLCIHSVCVDENHRRTKVGSR